MTVWLKATDIRDGDAEAAISRALQARTQLRDEGFWKRRLRRWAAGAGRRLLIIVDGLNQNFAYRGWSDLLQPLYASPWSGKVSVVATCRPDAWDSLKGLRDLVPEPVEIEVTHFSDAELDALLVPLGLARAKIAAGTLDLMRVPRLFAMAVHRVDDPARAYVLTPERLVLEDWRDRVVRHGVHAGLDEEEFRALVSRLGARFMRAKQAGADDDRISRRQLLEELGRESGESYANMQAAVSELIDGRWLPRQGRHSVALGTSGLPVALGLSLLDVVRAVVGAAAADEVISEFLDPLRGADIEVGVLRAAATAALVEHDVPPPVRRRLLLRWLLSQNFAWRDFDALWRLVALDIPAFLDVAEEGWVSGRFESLRDDFMAKAFVNASRSAPVAAALDTRFRFWISAAWNGPTREGVARSIEGADPQPTVGAIVSRIREALGPDVAGASLLHFGDRSSANLIKHALAVWSFTGLAGTADAIVAWALAGSTMGDWQHAQLVEWLLRSDAPARDETESEIFRASRTLVASGIAECLPAVGVLLAALATPASLGLAKELGIRVPDAVAVPFWIDWPCVPPESLPGNLTAGDVDDIAALAVSMDAVLGEPQRTGLVGLCRDSSGPELVPLIKAMGLRGLLPALARWAPEELGTMFDRLADEAVEALGEACPDWLEPIRDRGSFLAGFMRAPARATLASVFGKPPLSFTPPWKSGFDFVALELYGLTWDAQVARLAAAPIQLPDAAKSVLVPLGEDAIERAITATVASLGETGATYFWLSVLDQSLWLDPRELPPKLALRYMSDPDPRVRGKALFLVMSSVQHGSAAVAFADTGWSWKPEMERDESIAGSVLLLGAMKDRGAAVLDRADPQIAVEAFRRDTSEAPRLERFLRMEMAHVLARDIKFSINRYWCKRDQIRAFVGASPEAAVELIGPGLLSGHARGTLLFMGFPILDLCHGLLDHRPEVGAELWRSLSDEERQGITKSRQLRLMPFGVARTKIVDGLRNDALAAAKNDAELAQIADAATRTAGDGWLMDIIQKDLASSAASTVARAVTLAGFMNDTPSARQLWSDTLSRPPAPGWLKSVHVSAHAAFMRHRSAKHWLELALTSADVAGASAAHLLFLSAADARSIAWGQKRMEDTRDLISRDFIVRWNLGLAAFGDFEQNGDRHLEKVLFGTPISDAISPWA